MTGEDAYFDRKYEEYSDRENTECLEAGAIKSITKWSHLGDLDNLITARNLLDELIDEEEEWLRVNKNQLRQQIMPRQTVN